MVNSTADPFSRARNFGASSSSNVQNKIYPGTQSVSFHSIMCFQLCLIQMDLLIRSIYPPGLVSGKSQTTTGTAISTYSTKYRHPLPITPGEQFGSQHAIDDSRLSLSIPISPKLARILITVTERPRLSEKKQFVHLSCTIDRG